MATAYIAYGRPALPAPSGYQGGAGVSIFGLAVASEALTIGGNAAVTSARQYLAAATPVDVSLPAGAKIAVIAVS